MSDETRARGRDAARFEGYDLEHADFGKDRNGYRLVGCLVDNDMEAGLHELGYFNARSIAEKAAAALNAGADGLGREGVELLTEAGALFREYERHHIAKVTDLVGVTLPIGKGLELHVNTQCEVINAALAKARRNAGIAVRIEALLARRAGVLTEPPCPTEPAVRMPALEGLEEAAIGEQNDQPHHAGDSANG